jgi:hypothetical protein
MSTTQDSTPANTLATNDPGDEVQRRFRYQAAYAAIIALGLLDVNSEFEEIFCEHHEDTLIKKKDGTFIGVQVKTREPGKNPFKSDDEQIRHALKRFVEQDLDYPNYYSRFVLATNYAFWTEEKDNSKNLLYLLQLAKEAVVSEAVRLKRPLTEYINNLINTVNSGRSASRDIVLDVLSRVEVQDNNLPNFDDIESRIATHIPDFYDVGEARYDDLLKVAQILIDRMAEASSLASVSAKQLYFALCSNPAQARTDAIIEGKRITRETVEKLLRESLAADIRLHTKTPIALSDLPRGMRKLEQKMGKGGMSVSNITLAKALKYAYETHFDKWIYKYSDAPQRAIERYEQLKLIIGNECQESYDIVCKKDEPFGQEMLIDIRKRLRERWQNEPKLFFDCTYEHLLGVVGVLTELCEVWWSEQFDIPEDSVS